MDIDIIETVNELFKDIYDDYKNTSDDIFYKNLMQKRIAILTIIASSPINIYDTLYALTPKDYLLK
jgi:hypothetical protein